MGQDDGGGGSESLNLQNDVTTTISGVVDDKIVGSSSSSSSSFNEFEVEIGEDDASFIEYDENEDSMAEVLNLDTPSMIRTLSQGCDLSTLYGSPKQFPPIQVMGEYAGYDLNQVPSPVVGRKHRSNSGLSLASSESLFSIHTGNNSFSLDGGYFISQSGEFSWIDDHSCFTPDASKSSMSPGLATVMDDTAAENERRSASTNCESGELVESEREKGKASANSANISCNSKASCQSTNSFAFPILAGDSGSPSSTAVEVEKPQPETEEATQTAPKAPPTVPKAGGNQWFHCFSCFPMCC